VLAALLTSVLAGCSGGAATAPPVAAITAATVQTRVLSNDAIIASPPGRPHLVTSKAPQTLSRQSFNPPGSDIELFHDNFNTGSATGWNIANGAWVTQAQPGRTTEYTATTWWNTIFAGSDTWRDYGVEAYFRPENSAGSRRGTVLIARAVDADHFYQIEFANEWDGNHWEIWRNDGGGKYVNLASGAFPYVDDHQYLVQLKTFGSTISVSIADNYNRDFVNLASVTDTTYTHGRIGLRLWGGTRSTFDDVRVWTTSAYSGTGPAAAQATPVAMSTPGAVPYIAPAGTQPFPVSPFNNRISSPQYAPNSATMIARALNGENFAFGKIQVSTHDLSTRTDGQTTVYVAHQSDPHYKIHCMYYSGCPLEGADVAIPVGAIPGGNLGFSDFHDTGYDDQHMAVRNVDTQIETDMWLAPTPSGKGGTLNIGYGGKYAFSSGGIGEGGATAAGFALTQGKVRPVDLLAGHIPYALALATPCENGLVYPANGYDGGHDAGCPPIGAHIWLDSSPSDIANSGADPYWQVIFNALHEYGGYIGDRCACTLGVAPEGGVAYQAFGLANPWAQVISSHFSSETTAGPAQEYHLVVRSGNIDLSSHLHVII